LNINNLIKLQIQIILSEIENHREILEELVAEQPDIDIVLPENKPL